MAVVVRNTPRTDLAVVDALGALGTATVHAPGVAALADACARAFDITAEPEWRGVVASAWAWFEGDNDSGTAMFDALTGAGFDGLESDGRNENRGAESTLAALSTYQHARRLNVEASATPGQTRLPA